MVINKKEIKKIAAERIKRLLDMAQENLDKNYELSKRYVELAWKIKKRYNIRLSKKHNMRFCRKCQTYWSPGKTCRIRLKSKKTPHITITCEKCGYKKRIPYNDN